jgi:hypothetical protein
LPPHLERGQLGAARGCCACVDQALCVSQSSLKLRRHKTAFRTIADGCGKVLQRFILFRIREYHESLLHDLRLRRPDHTFFWDTHHPTEFGHAFFAVTLENALSAQQNPSILHWIEG